MLEAIATPAGFMTLLALLGLGAGGALVAQRHDHQANLWSNSLAIVAALWGMLFAASVMITSHQVMMHVAVSSLPFFSLSVHIDALAAFFVFVILLVALCCSVYGIGYVREYYKRYNIGALGFLYNLFILGMVLVVTAANGIFFLLAWEIMSLASYFLVVYDRQSAENVKAGTLYLIITHAASACLLLAFILLYTFTGSFDFATIAANAHMLPDAAKAAVFILAFIGLGTKAGVIPMHIWLPSAHPAAPSHVSALMSGVMIKTGIYMMIRLLLDMLQPIPLWWGEVILIAGAVSAVLGVLYALTEHDIKRLLAYHSIENIGIILLGLGSAMIFATLHQPGLETLALVATLFHTLNHALFKSLLFLGAGAVIQGTHTRNIEKYGGLLRLMPFTGLCFLVGSMAISALPPFNGFFSEWVTFQSLFGGLHTGGQATWIFLGAVVALALTGGLAAACFVKAFGAAFLARPHTEAAGHAKESPLIMRLGMGGLAFLCLVVGVLSGPAVQAIQHVAKNVAHTPAALSASTHSVVVTGYTASVSGPAMLAFLGVATLGVWAIVRFGVYRRQKVTIAPVWDCGTPLNSRMEITATGFAHSIIRVFKDVLRPTLQVSAKQNGQSAYAVSSRKVTAGVHDIYRAYIYTPIYNGLFAISQQVKRIQNGHLSAYILYMLAILLITLVVAR